MSTAVVTGAARGIGAATVRRLTADGWHVQAVDICADIAELPYALATRTELNELVQSINGAHSEQRVQAQVADVRDIDALAAAVAAAENTWGGVDAAIACAGAIAGGVPQAELSLAAEQVVLDVNLGGVLNLARVAVPALLRRPEPRSGRFIAIASGAASRGLPLLAAYCAAKSGIAGLIRALAAELGPSGVTACAISPGSTDTAMLAESARLYDLPDVAQFGWQQPVQRLVTADEVAEVVVALAGLSGGALTGAVIPVDGGFAV